MTQPERPAPTLAETALQFGENARGYAQSRIHREGQTRLLLLEHMQPVGDEVLLDVGCGPGGLTLTFAPFVLRAIGLDLAPEMLAAARLAARREAVENLAWVCGDVHRLPLADRSLDLVTSRATPHHFRDLGVAIGEMSRALKRGGRLGIADGTVPEDDELDEFINQLDTLHDPTTVRNYRPSEWRAVVERAGLRVDWLEEPAYEVPEGHSLIEWLARSGASSVILESCRSMLLGAAPRVRDYLRVRPEGDDVRFDLPRIVLVAKRID